MRCGIGRRWFLRCSAVVSAVGTSLTAACRRHDEKKSPVGGSIGVATMTDNGCIVLRLRVEGRGGIRGDAVLEYAPSDPDYQNIVRHLGGLRPGETKSVPPWPE